MFRAPFAAIKALFALSGWKVVGHPWWNAIELHLFSADTALYFRFESSSSIYEACDTEFAMYRAPVLLARNFNPALKGKRKKRSVYASG